ncbi:MAG: hypothetical protein ACLQHF_03345 [Terracidiphilus sp.]
MSEVKKCFVWLVALIGMGGAARAQQIEAPQPAGNSFANERAVAEWSIPPMGWRMSATEGQRAPKKTKAESGPPKPMNTEPIDPSMVGYIDDAAVGNEMRIRFDAGFNAPRPDRAEYFYAGSTSPAPSASAVQRTLNFQQLYLSGEYAPFKRLSAFVMAPFRWIEPFFISAPGQSPDLFSGGGIGDVQAGVKYAALKREQTHVTLQMKADFPSGNGAKGFGANHYSVEPMVLVYQKLNDRTALEGEAGDTHPIGGTYYTNPPAPPEKWSADVAMYGLGPSYELIERDKYSFAPVLELVAWHVFGGLQTGANNVVQSAAGINVFNAKLGGRVSFSNGSSIYAGYGRGITSDIWYRNLFRVEYRKAF